MRLGAAETGGRTRLRAGGRRRGGPRSPRHRPRPSWGAPPEVLRAHGGRPHWGTRHDLTAADVAAAYPRFDDFRRVRDDYDPERVFTNPALARLLGD